MRTTHVCVLVQVCPLTHPAGSFPRNNGGMGRTPRLSIFGVTTSERGLLQALTTETPSARGKDCQSQLAYHRSDLCPMLMTIAVPHPVARVWCQGNGYCTLYLLSAFPMSRIRLPRRLSYCRLFYCVTGGGRTSFCYYATR